LVPKVLIIGLMGIPCLWNFGNPKVSDASKLAAEAVGSSLRKRGSFQEKCRSRSTESLGSSLTFCRVGLQKGTVLAITAGDIKYHARIALVSEDSELRLAFRA
jgi:hypothetical protein